MHKEHQNYLLTQLSRGFFSFGLIAGIVVMAVAIVLNTPTAFADPPTTKVQCKDGKKVTAKKDAAKPNNILDEKDFTIACKDHKGYDDPAAESGGDESSTAGGTSVKELNPGEVTLTKKDAEEAQLNPISADKAISGTLNGVYIVTAIIAVIIIIASGISIMIADGDSQKVATARKAIIYACVGLVIVGSAFIITGIVQGIGS